MSHADAALTPRHRLKVAQLVIDRQVPIERFRRTPADRWGYARCCTGETQLRSECLPSLVWGI